MNCTRRASLHAAFRQLLKSPLPRKGDLVQALGVKMALRQGIDIYVFSVVVEHILLDLSGYRSGYTSPHHGLGCFRWCWNWRLCTGPGGRQEFLAKIVVFEASSPGFSSSDGKRSPCCERWTWKALCQKMMLKRTGAAYLEPLKPLCRRKYGKSSVMPSILAMVRH